MDENNYSDFFLLIRMNILMIILMMTDMIKISRNSSIDNNMSEVNNDNDNDNSGDNLDIIIIIITTLKQ